MITVRPTSLAATLDSAADALFYQKPIPADLRQDIVALLISRQIQSGSNSGFFIPLTAESAAQFRLFSGEPLNTEFAHRHIQLIEAARILKLLALDLSDVSKAIQGAEYRMDTTCYSRFCSKGECKSLTIAYMRYLTSSDLKDSPARLNSLLTKLGSYRDGKGKWNGFPYYYTLLMLSEVDDPLATHELQYAVPLFQKQPGLLSSTDPISMRRQVILTQAFSRSCSNAHTLLLVQHR
jgi:hypothetical protein